ncbi:putative isopenicillin N synthetase [Xylariaceae sp. FL0804]|nr:putative isopenicillin N synthetase [Xylariaceae sp. FL0804]
MSFTSVPILDLAQARDPSTKPAFLADLRHALMEVGFLYLRNVGIPDELWRRVISEGRAFFDIPEEEKLKIEMKNAPSFLGYSRLSAEVTAGAVDHREQIDLSTEHPVPGPDAPLYDNMLAPNQWPSPEVLPSFRAVFTEYMDRMGAVSIHFTSLIAEAVGLPPDAFDRYFERPRQQHKLKIVKYPDLAELGAGAGAQSGQGQGQGVGPHKDSMLTSYLLQASPHRGLQVQNMRGEWIDCPPVDGTLVVAIGQGLEALTQGACASTTHRVLSPAAGAGARFSIPFFQGVTYGATFAELEAVGVTGAQQQRRRVLHDDDDGKVEFTFRSGGAGGGAKTLGEATLRNRVKSHPDVGERWYPAILRDVREQQAREAQEKQARAQTRAGASPAGAGDEAAAGAAAGRQAVTAH